MHSQLQPMGKRPGELIIAQCIGAVNNSGSSQIELEMRQRMDLAWMLKHPALLCRQGEGV